MITKHENYARCGWAMCVIGLICAGMLAISVGCAQQEPGERSAFAADTQQPRGTLGVELRTQNDSVAITKIDAGSPADEAGLQAGDEVVLANGQAITSATDLQSVVKKAEKKDGELAIKIRRNDSERMIQANIKAARTPGDGGPQATESSTEESDAGTLAKTNPPADPAKPIASALASESKAPTESGTSDSIATESDGANSNKPSTPRHVVGYRGAEVNDESTEPSAPQNEGKASSQEAEDSGQRAELASKPEKPAEEPNQEIKPPGEKAAQSPSGEGAIASGDRPIDRDITLEKVEKELEEAKQALNGLISQRNKIEYQQEMERRLQEFDDLVATLEEDVKESQKQLSDKQHRLKNVRQKRDRFIAEFEELDPASADSWGEKREQINAAWQALQDAYRGESSDSDDS